MCFEKTKKKEEKKKEIQTEKGLMVILVHFVS